MKSTMHSLMLKNIPKHRHFSCKCMLARTQLAAIDHNSKTGRKIATVIKREARKGKRGTR